MVKSKDLADALVEETIHDMADSFFSRRKDLEDEIEHAKNLAGQVRECGQEALAKGRTLRLLLGQLCLDFLQGQGVTARYLCRAPETGDRVWSLAAPWAFTEKGLYIKTLESVYTGLHLACQAYCAGVYGPDPKNERRKRLSPNLSQLSRVLQSLNAEIDAVNSNQTATCLLDFTKQLDPLRCERENICGAVFHQDGRALDRDLAFPHLDLKSFNLPEIPELPPLDAARRALREFGGQAYKADSSGLRRLLKALSRAWAEGEEYPLWEELELG